MKRLAALLLVLSLFAGPLGADCLQRARVVTNHVSYAQTYYPSYHYVPVAVFDAIKPVYAVGGGYRAETAETADLARALEKLTAAVDRLSKGGTQTQADSLDAKAASVLAARCASCHTGPASKGKLSIFTAPGQLAPTVDRFLLWEAADSGRMPKGGQPIPDDEARVLREWVAQAAQQRRAQLSK